MKKIKTCFFLASLMAAFSACKPAEEEPMFPDPRFSNYLLANFDANQDGMLDEAEILAVDSINCGYLGINSLEGIERFSNLRFLYCHYNNLASLDLRGNSKLALLNCAYNNLSGLDVSMLPELMDLYCQGNYLETLDVSGNPELGYLLCSDNYLETLDVSGSPKLMYLYCQDNRLTTLDVSGNPKLRFFDCGDNRLTSLDLSRNPELLSFSCQDNCYPVTLVDGRFDLSQLPGGFDLSRVMYGFWGYSFDLSDSEEVIPEGTMIEFKEDFGYIRYYYATGYSGTALTNADGVGIKLVPRQGSAE